MVNSFTIITSIILVPMKWILEQVRFPTTISNGDGTLKSKFILNGFRMDLDKYLSLITTIYELKLNFLIKYSFFSTSNYITNTKKITKISKDIF